MIYYKELKDALRRQKERGGTIWYDSAKGMYYLVGDIE